MHARILAGSSPSIREIQEAFGFRSTATVREHLEALVEHGLLAQDPGRDRGLRIPGAAPPAMVPIAGRVHAGALSLAVEDAEGFVPVEPAHAAATFALRVIGESMAGREIHAGDLVLVRTDVPVRSGDVVVALVGEEATLKTYQRAGTRVVLQAENPDFADIVPAPDADFSILGRVCEVRRRL